MSSSVVSFGDAQLEACERRLRLALDAEVDALVSRYAPTGDPNALMAIANIMDDQAARVDCGGPHARLWAAALRQRAARARGPPG